MTGVDNSSEYFPVNSQASPNPEELAWEDDYVEWDEKYKLPPLDKPITSPSAQKIWIAINSVIDILFIKTLLKPFGLNTKEKREAWREKIRYFRAMIFMVLVMITLLFVLPFVVCSSSKAEKGILTVKLPYCMFLDVIYIIFMASAVGIMLMNVVAAIIVQRTGGKYKPPTDPAERPKKLLALHIPCYSESKEVILKTINSVVQSDYDDDSKLLFVVADGNVTGSGNDKSTPRILIEDVFKCEIEPRSLIYQSVGHGDQSLNKACVYTGYYSPENESERRVKYLLVVKVGLENEKEAAKPGNRSKRDSQLIVYNFFREANGFFLDEMLQEIATEDENPLQDMMSDLNQSGSSFNVGIAETSARFQGMSLWGAAPGNGYSVASYYSGTDSMPGTPLGQSSLDVTKPGGQRRRRKIRFSCPMFAEMYSSLKKIGCDAKSVEYVLVADADTFIRPNGLDILVHTLEKDQNLSGVCGETKVENRTQSYITMIQVFEYFLTHCLLKSFESFYANVLVLSGCFTIYRLKRHVKDPITQKEEIKPAVLDPRIMRDYMAEPKLMREHNLLTIGEDRYLCTLVIRYLTDMRTRYIPSAVCTTTVPDKLSILLCQRRRWTNSLIHNHFDLFVNPPAFPTRRMRWSMKLVMVSELWSASAIPFFLPLGCCIAIWGLWTHLTWLSLAFTLVLFCLPGLIALMAGRKTQACWWLMFIAGLPLWAVVIPLYSLWKMDDFSWGSTRPTDAKTILDSVQEIESRHTPAELEQPSDLTCIEIPENAYPMRNRSTGDQIPPVAYSSATCQINIIEEKP